MGSELRRVGEVLVARLADGRVVAFSAVCPHQRTDLGDGCLVGDRIQCRLHHYEYDVVTGENVVPARDTDPSELWKAAPGYLPVFPVEERDGSVWIGSSPLPPPASYDPALERREDGRPAEAGPGPAGEAVVRVAVGTTFELRLEGQARAGFVWRVEAGGSCVAVVGERAEPSGYVVRLAARAVGRSTVRCLYARPWDRSPAEVRAYEVVVEGG